MKRVAKKILPTPLQPARRRKLLFGLGLAYLPTRVTGANVAFDALCRRLIAEGFDPVVVCGADEAKAPPAASAGTPALPYPVLRLADPVAALADMVARLDPAAVVVQDLPFAARAAAHRTLRAYPVRVMLVTSMAGLGIPTPSEVPLWRYAANSRFLVALARAYIGAPIVFVPPLIEPSAYRCEAAGREILFVNPVADKGVHIAAEIARRLPGRQFLFARSWPNSAHHPHVDVPLPNVQFAEPTLDMRALYARARLVLVPSVWEEAWGRVVTEAHASGIPVIASDRGGLPESVGPGGIVLSLAEPIDRWCAAVEALFTDRKRHAVLSQLALHHARRREIAPADVFKRFLRFVAG